MVNSLRRGLFLYCKISFVSSEFFRKGVIIIFETVKHNKSVNVERKRKEKSKIILE